MKTPVKKRRAEIDRGEVVWQQINRDSYASPGQDGLIDGSPISKPGKRKRVIHNSPPIGVLIIDPNITPPAAQP